MKKFNGFEGFLIQEGLKKVMEDMIAEIEKAEANGKRPIMTAGFVMMTMEELVKKVGEMTKKEK
jgi:predicted transcriptional regulator